MTALVLNGHPVMTEADPATPLLYVLRDDFQLYGAKFGCGLGQCGACTVLLDNQPVFSCVTPLVAVEGRSVRTVEGLGTIDDPGPVQRAFIAEQAAQCGYCIPGMMMRAQALLEHRRFAQRGGDPPHHAAQSVPLRYAYPHPSGDPPGGAGDGRPMNTMNLSRRAVMAGGALLVGFRLAPALAADATNEGDLKVAPALDSWVRISPDGDITVLTGKAELGQGISTAIIQVAAEELDVRPERIMLITADTGRTPNEGYTAGSHSMDDSGTAVRDAAACVRALLMQAAALRWGVPPGRLQTADGVVLAPDGRRATYGSLVGAVDLHRPVLDPLPLRPASAYTLVGRSMPRVDIPAKLTGIPSFVQDMRLPGMLHARVVRPIAYGGALLGVDEGAALRIPGVVKVVREGSFLGVIAEREFAADPGDAGAGGIGAVGAGTRPAETGRRGHVPPDVAHSGHCRPEPGRIRRGRQGRPEGALHAPVPGARSNRPVLRRGAV